MKVIKKYYTLFLLVFISFSCEKTERELYTNEDGRFVRFTMMVKPDGTQVGHSRQNPSAAVVSKFNYSQKKILKIPVSLTSETFENDITVNFSTNPVGNFTGFKIEPSETLTFSKGKLNDTISISFNQRWPIEPQSSITLKLENASDPEVQIGLPNKKDKFDELTIFLGALKLRYYLPTENMFTINGDAGEEVFFDVSFPDGFFTSEIENKPLVKVADADFSYSLEQLPYTEDDSKITYKLTVEEALKIDEFSYSARIELEELDNYFIGGTKTLTIEKPEKVDRDVTLNTASNFYNLDDPFYRTFGETWMDFNKDGECKWQAFNTFTFPVEVSASHPDAILYDDNGTPSTEDDIYHHAFRVGFNSPNAGRTTNSFNLKRWFENDYTDADKSPGFNITQALEFYPESGTSASNGLVKVISQEVVISSRDDKSYVLQIEGEGVYSEVSPGTFKLEFELRVANSELFGGTQAAKYVLFNTNNYTDPDPLTEGCFMPVEL